METEINNEGPMIKRGKRVESGLTQAETADRHKLYEYSVQATDFEYDFVDSNFKRLRGRTAKLLREDFCGSAQMSCEWVKHRKTNRSIGVDLDADVLAWARKHNVQPLKPDARPRVSLLQENVMTVETKPVDIVLAMNFSWQIFSDRDTLREYFVAVRNGLVDDGVFFLDIFGGYEAQKELKEKTKHKDKGFTYVWEQATYNPIDGMMQCYIHFHFKDKSKIQRAFSYRWRLWSLPELQEILKEAGFSTVTVYWQGEDEDGEADGDFQPATEGDADPGWVCMISAEK
ncbi:MAG: class I SAM-dependent methyltransferase [Gammaproteobacteria bacterium]